MKFRFLDVLLYSLLFIFVVSFPINMLGLDLIWQYVISIGLKAILLTYYISVLWTRKINIFKFANYRVALLFIPFLLACFSNLIATQIIGVSIVTYYDPSLLAVVIVSTVLTAINEEFLFRFFIQSSLVYASTIKRVVVSALIFSLFHLLTLVEVRSVASLTQVLVQAVYTFGLGLILGLMYEYTYSLPLCMWFHFTFNFMNSVLISNMLVDASNTSFTLAFYLTAIVIGVVLAIYGTLIYIFVLSKHNKYFRE